MDLPKLEGRCLAALAHAARKRRRVTRDGSYLFEDDPGEDLCLLGAVELTLPRPPTHAPWREWLAGNLEIGLGHLRALEHGFVGMHLDDDRCGCSAYPEVEALGRRLGEGVA